ncbi:MAG: hypothetical protein DRI44_00190 [Chlamydiae bacterium]|nr:MAG: hypothetical protein DRI44_00190 [Chlamydiota bacterium]
MANVKISDNLFWVGVQDHDLKVFDVIMQTEYGTSYNSYLLKTDDGAILFETSKGKTFDIFISNLQEVCDLSEIKYIVIDHTEPDHTGSLEKLLKMTPNATILASAIALRFLRDICNREIPGIAVTESDVISLGGYDLKFLSVPFLHWPDSIYTYIEKIKTLVTCDSFGCHYADDKVCNDLIEGDFVDAYKYYFDAIMGPFKPYVQNALKKIAPLDIKTICPGHGPVLREKLDFYINLYDEWSKETTPAIHAKPKVTIAYVSAYGYTEELANKIANGISDVSDADVKSYDMVTAKHDHVLTELIDSDGILLGSPTVNGDALPPVTDLILQMNGVLHGGKVAGAFGSYGWSGEAADMLMGRLNVLRMKTLEPPLKAIFKPSDDELNAAYNYGRRFARKLIEEWKPVGKSDDGATLWKCTVCGEVFEGALPPMSCPVCGAGPEAFVEFTEEVITFSSKQEFKTVIIGSGPGAINAAVALRKRNSKAVIDIYSADKDLPYYRPSLTKRLSEELKLEEILLFPNEYYEKNKINLHLDTEITKISPAEKTIYDANNNKIKYDKLIIATGAHCFVPPLPGADLPEVITLRNFRNFTSIKNLIENDAKKIVVVGGGLLGLEVANSLKNLGVKVTVLEMAPRILPRQMDNAGSEILTKIINASGIEMKTDIYAEEVVGDMKVRGVATNKSGVIPCDAVIFSAGIRSNINLATNAGIEVNRGIVVNEKMQTSLTDIYAVGDCCSFNNVVTGLWEPAIEQGKVAGAHIAGDSVKYEPSVIGATMNAFGTSIFSVGDLGIEKGSDYTQITCRNDVKPTYKNIYFKKNVLCGGLLLGDLTMTNPLLSGVKKGINTEIAMDNKLI